MLSEICMVKNWETASSQLTRLNQRELKTQGMATEGEGGALVEEIGHRQARTIASSAEGQDIGLETVHQLVVVEVVAHCRHLHVLDMVAPLAVTVMLLMIAIDLWMIDSTEAVMVIGIVMTAEMIDMQVDVIDF